MFAAVLMASAAAIVGLNLYAPAEPSPLQRMFASLLVALCAMPSIMWAARRPWRTSLLPLVGILYAASFAAPVFVHRQLSGSWFPWPLLDSEAIDGALLLALGGWSALMVGYFALSRSPRPTKWPTIQVLPNDDPKLARTVAVVVGFAAVPFLYLDNAAVVAQHVGAALLPGAIAFPVTLAGQFVVFATLMLFHLHLRGQLGVAGRLLLVAFAVYYTALGLGTGMVNHGIKALFALVMAYAVVAPTPTWRGVVFGLAAGAVVVFVLLPARMDYRQLIWTHGVGPNKTLHIATHRFEMDDGEEHALETADYSAMLRGRVLTFAHNDPNTCRLDPAQPPLRVAVFVDPARLEDLPDRFQRRGHELLGFSFADGSVENTRCVAGVRLPDYPMTAVRAVLHRMEKVGHSDIAQHPDTPADPGRNPGAPQAHRSLAKKVAVYATTVAATVDGESVSRAMDLTPSRLDYLLPLAWVMQHTPDPLPYLRGETYAPLPYKLVPRLVFADKPADVDDLGKRYDFVPVDSMNNFKVHQLGEFYVNFGVLGALVGMFLLGLLYRTLHALFHKPGACVATMAAGTHMLTVLAVEMESILSVSLGFLAWYAIVVGVLAIVVRVVLRLRPGRR